MELLNTTLCPIAVVGCCSCQDVGIVLLLARHVLQLFVGSHACLADRERLHQNPAEVRPATCNMTRMPCPSLQLWQRRELGETLDVHPELHREQSLSNEVTVGIVQLNVAQKGKFPRGNFPA
ncbi:hypothetical protein [uncultured Azohydromonas sp.]|uniref:hypothetical protein n=1 Tax=uncultured Azohydromonas sp. TaxID=487342 RepID=UPI0026386867|nr:hypothetical protein [uncultured Azohydromonas sp.]